MINKEDLQIMFDLMNEIDLNKLKTLSEGERKLFNKIEIVLDGIKATEVYQEKQSEIEKRLQELNK